jgi:hypothetical protein
MKDHRQLHSYGDCDEIAVVAGEDGDVCGRRCEWEAVGRRK